MNIKTIIATALLCTFLCGGLYAQLLEPVAEQKTKTMTVEEKQAAIQNEMSKVEKALKGINEVPIEKEIQAEESMYKTADEIAYNSSIREKRALIKDIEQTKKRTAKFLDLPPKPEKKVDVHNAKAVREYLLNETVKAPKVPVSFYDNI